MADGFEIQSPLPPRRAASALRDQLVRYLSAQRLAVGAPFLTDADLVRQTHLSRSTVRRAMDVMAKEGWIDRRIGSGTFVGPRGVSSPQSPTGRKVVRLAVLIFAIGDLANDWYTPHVLEGIDLAAEEYGVQVELVGNRDRDIDAISRRLQQSPPDVLACLSPEPIHAMVIRDAQKLGVRCVVTGTPHMELGLPAICEDNRQAMRLGVQHLKEHGHTRIGLLLQRYVERWVFDRHEGFLQAMRDEGLDSGEAGVAWFGLGDKNDPGPDGADRALTMIRDINATAVICGSYAGLHAMEQLSAAGRIRVPEQLSVLTCEGFTADRRRWFGGIQPTHLVPPLRQIGQSLAAEARALVEGESVPQTTYHPWTLVPGNTVTSLLSPSPLSL